MKLEEIQVALRREGLSGWLFCDFQNRDPISYRILDLPTWHATRRWFYFVPSRGLPRKLVSSVEPGRLDALPGEKVVYRSWLELQHHLKETLRDVRRVAMQYSPLNRIPYVSTVDAGTVELVRMGGIEVVSSADLVQEFEALVSPEGFASHVAAGERVHRILSATWAEIGERLARRETLSEYDIKRSMLDRYRQEGLTCDGDGPIVAVGVHAADPHFDPTPDNTVPIRAGDTLLVDTWARLDGPGAIYYDVTWCAFVGDVIPAAYAALFRVATGARDAAVAFVRERLAAGGTLYGWEVDQICRDSIEAAGWGQHFVHRTGHSIGTAVHGNGVNIDNLETQDDRRVVPGCLFSIEPGIYVPEQNVGVRTELDVFVDTGGKALIEGPVQDDLVLIPVA